jgi:hypothetical protein
MGRADNKNLRTRGGRISKATTSVETSSLISSVRPARHDGCASVWFVARQVAVKAADTYYKGLVTRV